MKSISLIGAVTICAILASGCTSGMPKAWQRGQLAHPAMSWDPDAMDSAIRSRTYASKEAASGSATVAGGGCGCN